jgi:hypothetical protein
MGKRVLISRDGFKTVPSGQAMDFIMPGSVFNFIKANAGGLGMTPEQMMQATLVDEQLDPDKPIFLAAMPMSPGAVWKDRRNPPLILGGVTSGIQVALQATQDECPYDSEKPSPDAFIRVRLTANERGN